MKQAAADAAEQLQPAGALQSGAHFALTDDLLAGRFFSIDVRGHVTGWNTRAEAAFGWSTHHISGGSLFDKLIAGGSGFGPEDVEQFFAPEGAGAGRRVRVLIAHQSGSQLPVELAIVPIELSKAYELNAFLQDVSTSTASGVASEIGRIREEHADVLEMIAESLQREPGSAPGEEVRLAGALVVFHIDATAGSIASAAAGGAVVAPAPAVPSVADDETARADAERVRAQIDAAHAEAQEARADADSARRERDELQARLEAAAGDSSGAEQAAEAARREAEQAVEAARREVEEAAEVARREGEELRAQADQAVARAAEAESAAERSRTELEQALGDAERLRGELSGLRTAADGTQASAEATAAELGEARAELSHARSDVERLGQELATARAELAQAAGERDALRAEVAELRSRVEVAGEVESALAEAREQVAALDQELTVARADAQSAQDDTAAAHAELDQVRKQAEEAERRAQEADRRADEVAADAAAAREGGAAAEAAVAAARDEANAARADVEAATGKVADAATARDAAAARADQLDAELSAAREEMASLREELQTARAEAETAQSADSTAADSAALFERVFDSAAIGMAIKVDGRFTRVNRALCELTGHDADALLAVDPVDLVHRDERKAHKATEKSLRKGEITTSYAEARLIHADGSDIHVRETTSLLDDGRILAQFERAAAEAHVGVEEPAPAPPFVAPEVDDEPEAGNLPVGPEADGTSTALAPVDGLVERLRQALVDDGFLLFAQPIIDLRTSEITQYELLLRMPEESGRLLLPDKFLPVARSAGLMQEIDQWVVRRAIALIHAAALDGKRLMLEVNISADSVDSDALTATVEAELDATGIDPRLLVIEVTEAAALEKIEAAIKLSKKLRAMGCRFAIDDFGSTFATVKYLKDLAVDFFKLDGDLIVTLPESRTNQLLLNALMDVARGTGTQTIAVYVPDDETLVMLRQYGIGYGQGNRVGRPRPVDEI